MTLTPVEELLAKKLETDIRFVMNIRPDSMPHQLAKVALQRVLQEGWGPTFASSLQPNYHALFEEALNDLTLLRAQLQECTCQRQG